MLIGVLQSVDILSFWGKSVGESLRANIIDDMVAEGGDPASGYFAPIAFRKRNIIKYFQLQHVSKELNFMKALKRAERRNVLTCVSFFIKRRKATWPKTFSFVANGNYHGSLSKNSHSSIFKGYRGKRFKEYLLECYKLFAVFIRERVYLTIRLTVVKINFSVFNSQLNCIFWFNGVNAATVKKQVKTTY